MMKNDKNEKVKGKHYDIAGISTIAYFNKENYLHRARTGEWMKEEK